VRKHALLRCAARRSLNILCPLALGNASPCARPEPRPATPMNSRSSPPSLVLRAGTDAIRVIRDRGLRAEDIDVVPGASGGPKWLVLAALDRYLFGEFFRRPRNRPLHLIGSSIGSWRLACFAQNDPVAALDRTREAYIEQCYPPSPSPALVSATGERILDSLLGTSGTDEVLSHPWARLHVITAECRGLAAREGKIAQTAALLIAAAGNLVSRRSLALQMRRVVFHAAGDESPFLSLSDFPTRHATLTRENLKPALMASGAIPLVLAGVPISGDAAGIHRDGGIIDYHLDLDFGAGDGLVLYPHFYPHVVPGWFDKSLRWRRGRPHNFRRALILAPSPDFVASLPFGRIPDRSDFSRLSDGERVRAWRTTVAATRRIADELHDLLETGRVADALQPI